MTNKTKKEPLLAPKGMHDKIDEEYYNYQGFFEKAQEVAVYYGFKPIEVPILEREEVFTTGVGVGTDIVDKEMYNLKTKGGDHLAMRPEGTAGVMRAYIEHGMQTLPQPVMLYYYGPFFRHDNPQKGRLREFRQFGLEILGSDKSINDAMIIKMAVNILEEAGAKNLSVEINSIGDKDCRHQYTKELVTYYRKHINTLCGSCKQRIKENPLRLLDCKDPKCLPIKENAPDIIGFLSPSCKQHFKEVLEYLEAMKIPYNLNKNLVRGLSYYSKTVFEITENNPDDEEPLALAGGGRYDYLAKNLGSKKDVSAIGVAIGVDRVVSAKWSTKLSPRIMKKPKIYFIQLGNEAKLKSLNIIEILRKARIPIHQSLSKDSLGVQLGIAEKLQIPYTIIFGQKEALEDSVLVRDMETRSQKTVKIKDLPEYLKKTL
ncbi:MAG: histidine--tRNA ligase [Candidatus Paceibacterota bacterium]|jgi:histidyl-tRNA synthetase